MEIQNPVVLREFSDSNAAELAAMELRGHGIACLVVADDAGGMIPPLQLAQGVRLLVDASERETAERLLEPAPANTSLASEFSTDVRKTALPRAARLFLGYGLMMGLVLGAVGYWAYQQVRSFGIHEFSQDNDGDGRADEFFVYDGTHIVSIAQDRNRDRKRDAWFFYDQEKLSRYEADENFDGAVDVWQNYSNGLPTFSWSDTDFNGKPDGLFLYSNDVLVKLLWRPNQRTNVEKEVLYENGVMIEERSDIDGDGQFDVSVRFNAFGTPISTNLHPKLPLRGR